MKATVILSLTLVFSIHFGTTANFSINYYLYTNENITQPVLLTPSTYYQVSIKHPTKIVVHGYYETAEKIWYQNLTNEYLLKGNFNVIQVDWSHLAFDNYKISSQNTQIVGSSIGNLIITLHKLYKLSLNNVHLIGHSLGAHACGYAGKKVKLQLRERLGRITALDAAGPLFEFPFRILQGISKNDATIVDAIHTDGGVFGREDSIGTADFYPNGGKRSQPGCNVKDLSYPLTSFEDLLDKKQFLWENVHKWENKTALVCTVTKRSYTYAEVYKKTNALANFFHKYDQVKQSDVILIGLPNVPEYPIISLGSIQAGLIVSTINPFYTADEISKQLVSCKPKVIFTYNGLYPTIKKALSIAKQAIPIVIVKTAVDEQLPRETIDFKSIIQGNTKPEFFQEKDLNDTIFLIYSSGTTGIPKGVQLTHKNIVSNLQQMGYSKINCLSEPNEFNQEVVPVVLPLYHCYGLIICLLNGLRFGCKLLTIPKFSSDLFLNVLNNYSPTLMHIAPPIFLFLLNNPNVSQQSLHNLKTLICGAAPLGAADLMRFHEKNDKINVLQAYGLTEASPLTHIQSSYITNGRKTGGVGYLLPSTKCRIVSIETGNELLANQKGELLISGPQVMKGYYHDSKATSDAIQNEWLKTGDVGYYDEDNHFFITDRIKELIKVKGYQVAPAELEEVLRDHPGVEDAAVVGIPHAKFGEVPKAFVVLKSHTKTKSTDIQDHVNKSVSHFKQLHGGVTIINKIPKSPSGKILRRVLKET
ncbi:hypothetical protein RN001_002954 [Aquatica leii]|uniref:Luciferin 4-monooxygenase n=1 Tax=Aquatica leii TaxID=1421715 RepID=A0AAN7QNT5_9COLE|nr:hypothetical protein RN001_002954 [Aquatica leii]